MQVTDALWHIVNFFVPALALGGMAALATRWLWRRELAGVSVWRLWAWASGAAAMVSVGGLLTFQHDGKMATYAAMVVASALALWWSAFLRAGR